MKNKDYKVAEVELKNLELTTVTEEEFSETVANNLVTRTQPQAGEKVPAGSTVTIYKSIGPELKKTKVPDLTGKTLTEAKKELSNAKLSLGKILPEESSNVTAKIVNQNPAAGQEVTEETAVDITFEVQASPTPKSSVTPGKSPAAQTKTLSVSLNGAPQNPDKIRVIVKLTPSDTKVTEIRFDGYKKQSDFPFLIQVDIPNNGSTNVYIEVDGNVYYNYNLR
jgi:serine/threonine-protein kinase